MNDMIEKLSHSILSPLIAEKLAADIMAPCFEKTASGGQSFLSALSGSKAKALKQEVAEISKEVADKSSNPAIQDAYNAFRKVQDSVGNTSVHPRMQGVKEGLEEARKNYHQTAAKHDETLNKFVGYKKPLVLLHPFQYGKAKVDTLAKKMKLNNSKAQYEAQEKRIKGDIKEELDSAKQKYEDVKTNLGLNGSVEKLEAKMKERDKAVEATRSARTVAGVGAAGVAGGAYYMNKKDNPEPGPYTIDPYKQAADDMADAVEKMASEILQCMIQK